MPQQKKHKSTEGKGARELAKAAKAAVPKRGLSLKKSLERSEKIAARADLLASLAKTTLPAEELQFLQSSKTLGMVRATQFSLLHSMLCFSERPKSKSFGRPYCVIGKASLSTPVFT